VMNLALRRKRLIAHVLMRDEQDRVPLYETQFKEDWERRGASLSRWSRPGLERHARCARSSGLIFKSGGCWSLTGYRRTLAGTMPSR
jgi:hypothetical protein